MNKARRVAEQKHRHRLKKREEKEKAARPAAAPVEAEKPAKK